MGRCFLYSAGAGAIKGEIVVTAEPGSVVKCSKGAETKTAEGNNGVWLFTGISNGTWTITATHNGETITDTVVMDYPRRIFLVLVSNIPAFSYTGDFEIVNDSDDAITYSRDNWKIRFLTSGTLTFTKLNGAKNGIDVFLVGGGGGGGYGSTFNGGGGGGYTTTAKGVSVAANTAYEIVVGDGGAQATAGENTTAFGETAKGGSPGNGSNYWSGGYGGNGGSGGGGGGKGGTTQYTDTGVGGSDGSDGGSTSHDDGTISGGKGQGTTTREFGESTGTLYSGGGGGGSWSNNGGAGGDGGGGDGADYGDPPNNGEPNTGGGGGGARWGTGSSGGSGIVIIRNKR